MTIAIFIGVLLGTMADSHALHSSEAFKRGWKMSLHGRGALLSNLFSVRALGLFDRLSKEEASSYLSGLLIGEEVRSASTAGDQSEMTVIGEERLCQLYLEVLTACGLNCTIASAGAAVRGLWQIALSAGLIERCGMNGSDLLHQIPLIAILRGVKPAGVIEVAQAISQSGIRIMEIPLNSPDPYTSIGLLNETFPDHLIGAGTVMSQRQVDEVFAAGGRIIVMPHSNAAIIHQAKARGMICLPGVATPSEGFAALACGADGLKLFPAEQLPPSIVKAWRAVFIPATLFFPVGGITPESIAAYLKAGASGFGLGSHLYQPGMTATLVASNAKAFVSSLMSPNATVLNPT